ncbi:MAG: hypothetical protein R8J85_09020 [Mariprofundales bacterium]
MTEGAFPSTTDLLITGNDPRLALDPNTGMNHYLCRPTPDLDMLRFGSSTASNIDAQGWATANRFRNQLAQESATIGIAPCLQQHHDRICNELKSTCHLDPSIHITLTESGTITHRLAAMIADEASTRPLHAIIMQPSETGSGAPSAVTLGNSVPIHTIALRTNDGSPCSAADIDRAVIQQSEQVIKQGASLLLVMVDCSKSGMQAPALTTALQLRQRFPDRIHLLLDGCQFRFDCDTLRHYLQQGAMVAITGSKFLAGPSFSAALLTPNGTPFPSTIHAGLLLRWQVALDTLHSLYKQDGKQVQAFVQKFAQQMLQRLNDDPKLSPLPSPTMPQATIFPFCLQHNQQRLSMDQTMIIYQQLQQHSTPKIQLGRPIHAGLHRDGTISGALRLNLSAPLIIDAIANNHQHAVINQAMATLDQVLACAHAQGMIH